MKVIQLGKYGHFLSGRRLPHRILSELPDDDGREVTLDFAGVSGCNQAFVNELFQRLVERGVVVAAVKLTGMDNDNTLRHIVEAERDRYLSITKASRSNGIG